MNKKALSIFALAFATIILVLAIKFIPLNENTENIRTETTIAETTETHTASEVTEATTESTSITASTTEETTAEENDEEDFEMQQYEDLSYDDLMRNLEKSIAHFDESMRKKLRIAIDFVYNNAGVFNDTLKILNYPSKEYIINEKIIKPLAELDKIDIVTIQESYDDFCKLRVEYGGSCYIPEENRVLELISEYDVETWIRVLIEEIIHSGQHLESKDWGWADFSLISEGEANIIASSLCNNKIDNDYHTFVYENGDIHTVYQFDGLAYSYNALSTRYYAYLSSLLGRNTIEKFRKEKNANLIREKLSDTYNIDGEKFYNNMLECIVAAYLNRDSKKSDYYIKVEKTFFKCYNKKIDSVKSKEEAEEVLETYRYLNNQFRFECFGYDEDYNETIITEKYVDKKITEDKLYNMACKYNLLQISKNPDENKKIFHALINPVLDEEENKYHNTILDADIKFDGKNVIITNNGFTCKTDINTGISKCDCKPIVIPDYPFANVNK